MSEHPSLNVVLHDVRIIDPAHGRDGVGDVVVLNGFVSEDMSSVPADCAHVDCRGLVAAPAFVDLHCHLREPGFEEKETIATGTAAAAAGGLGSARRLPKNCPPTETLVHSQSLLEINAPDAVGKVPPVARVTPT